MVLEGGRGQQSMKTVSTLCASGAGLGLAPVGLAVIREDALFHHHHIPAASSPPDVDMTAVASPYPQLNHSTPLAISTPASARSVSEGQNGKARPGRAVTGQKRTLTPSASFSVGVERPAAREEGSGSRVGTPSSQPTSWLRRLSSNMSTSRDSSRTPTSRPGSAAISHSNGSITFSHAGSASPIFPDNAPTTLPPNKLVKRTSSLRSANGVPFSSSGSKLPRPVLKRPATSHQRSATLQQETSGTDQSDRMSIDGGSSEARDFHTRHYFTPKSASADWAYLRKRSSSGIPTPIKRIYPDRKYVPVLAPASHAIKPAPVEIDDGVGLDEEDAEANTNNIATPSIISSSPLPSQTPQFQEGATPRRSFSISDLLSGGPQPLWRRPSQKKSKNPGSRIIRRRGQRVVSAPEEPMGNAFSVGGGTDSERPAKRRDVTNPRLTPRSIYSSSSSNPRIDAESQHGIPLDGSSKTPLSERFDRSHSPGADAFLSNAWSTPPLEQTRFPSANSFSGVAKAARVSAAQSEVTSLVDSDSEYRSIGDASTDYQSDTVFNSYNTRTTRSSSGRRGPHIEKIFEDSPPNFPSGRSTKLQDLLQDGSVTANANGSQYRHSTIEEEGSITSTPVRSLRTNSVMSTPSARPGVPQTFPSSPPTMRIMPDPDEIDWDASDEELDDADNEDERTHSTYQHDPYGRAIPFRAGPALRDSLATEGDSTPDRLPGPHSERSNLFDWSEVQPSPSNASPPRPRTVHGKKNAEGRGSRAVGRRAPSGMHARSHSVPVAPETGGRRTNNVVANKFGTWNVGSKVVTEDWNDDFAFDEASELLLDDDVQEEDSDRKEKNMFVPRSIREQQENVVANIGLLREWGLLIEELKELRIRASALGMLDGPYAREWEEVDAMIELADQESEEDTLEPRRSPPSSPSFDNSAFEEQLTPAQARGQTSRLSNSIGPGEASSSAAPSQQLEANRPRKDSEAVAQSIIQALQSRRIASDPSTSNPVPRPKKVPFDTATLRHIVPYVSGLKRKVKEALRETEGLRTSPHRPNHVRPNADASSQQPPFPSPFDESRASMDTVVRRRSRREQAVTDHDGFESPSPDQGADLATRVQRMNLPR